MVAAPRRQRESASESERDTAVTAARSTACTIMVPMVLACGNFERRD